MDILIENLYNLIKHLGINIFAYCILTLLYLLYINFNQTQETSVENKEDFILNNFWLVN